MAQTGRGKFGFREARIIQRPVKNDHPVQITMDPAALGPATSAAMNNSTT
jgi:hypothetical protein